MMVATRDGRDVIVDAMPFAGKPRSAASKLWFVIGGGALVALLGRLFSEKRAFGARSPEKPHRVPETRPVISNDGVSPNGARFVATFEGFQSSLYNDPAGHCTIGFGHLVHLGPCDGTEPDEFRRGIDRPRALELLEQELAEATSVVRRLVTVPLTQVQLDALVSFVFNVGQDNFAKSTLLQLLNRGDYAGVPAQLNRFVFADGKKLPGLVRRREAEGRLFATGDYDV